MALLPQTSQILPVTLDKVIDGNMISLLTQAV